MFTLFGLKSQALQKAGVYDREEVWTNLPLEIGARTAPIENLLIRGQFEKTNELPIGNFITGVLDSGSSTKIGYSLVKSECNSREAHKVAALWMLVCPTCLGRLGNRRLTTTLYFDPCPRLIICGSCLVPGFHNDPTLFPYFSDGEMGSET